MRTITIPGTTIFNLLIEKLFSLVPDEHLDYTYDSHAVRTPQLRLMTLRAAHSKSHQQTSKLHSATELLLREEVFHRITEVFKRHGAMLLETPLLVPKVNSYSSCAYISSTEALKLSSHRVAYLKRATWQL